MSALASALTEEDNYDRGKQYSVASDKVREFFGSLPEYTRVRKAGLFIDILYPVTSSEPVIRVLINKETISVEPMSQFPSDEVRAAIVLLLG